MARIRTPQTVLSVALRATLIAGLLLVVSGCATGALEQKRSLLDGKCQQRMIAMLNAVSPVVAGDDISQKFCGCLTSKVDVVKLEADIDGVKDIGLNPETLRFVTEYIPTVRACAKETVLWRGL